MSGDAATADPTRKIYIDDRLELYEGYIPDDWGPKVFGPVKPRAGRKSYRTDLTDAQWGLVKDLLPAPKSLGRPRKVDLREVANTILYQARTGC